MDAKLIISNMDANMDLYGYEIRGYPKKKKTQRINSNLERVVGTMCQVGTFGVHFDLSKSQSLQISTNLLIEMLSWKFSHVPINHL